MFGHARFLQSRVKELEKQLEKERDAARHVQGVAAVKRFKVTEINRLAFTSADDGWCRSVDVEGLEQENAQLERERDAARQVQGLLFNHARFLQSRVEELEKLLKAKLKAIEEEGEEKCLF